MIGTLINAGTVIVGSCLGLWLHTRLPRRITVIAFQVIGLFTLFVGFSMALKTANFLIMIFSGVIGAIIGELCKIDLGIDRFGEGIKVNLKSQNDKFSEGFVTAFLLFCMGSMTILGAFEEAWEASRIYCWRSPCSTVFLQWLWRPGSEWAFCLQ
jgi:uncharacterized membrane protein YqgA involved in biofilm formation